MDPGLFGSHWTQQKEPMTDVMDAYKAFDLRQPGWIKVKLDVAQ
jgi:hypothetical protein